MIENNEILKTASDFSRQKFIDMGISYSKIGSIEFYKLVEILEKELKDYAQKGGLEMIISKTPKRNAIEFNLDKNGGLQTAHIKVDGYYFKGRQAISFENNWIGFAGWADSDNVKPFTNAFDKWLDACFGSKTENITQLQNKVINFYGLEKQKAKLKEEMTELAYARDNENFIEEMADVLNVMQGIISHLNCGEKIREIQLAKLQRQERRIKAENKVKLEV